MLKDKLISILPKVLPYLAILGVGIGAGWYLKPSQVKTEERVKLVEVQVTTEAIKALQSSFETLKIELQRVRETQVVEKYHREELETKLADGTYTKKVTVDKNIDSHTKEVETRVEIKVVEVEKKTETIKTQYVDKIVEKEKIVTPILAQWHAGAILGINPSLLPSPVVTSYIVGAEVERRIIGPIFGGVWVAGSTTGQAFGGIKLAVEF